MTARSAAATASLSKLGISFEQRSSESPSNLEHKLGAKVSFHAGAGAAALSNATASATVEFGSEGSFLLQVQGCVEHSIDNKPQLQKKILAALAEQDPEKRWSEEWAVIDTIYRAATTTVMISSSAKAQIEISARGTMTPGPYALAHSSLGLSVGSSSDAGTQLVAVADLVPMFKASKLRKKLLHLLGAQELHATRSFGVEPEEAELTLEAAPTETWRALVIGVDHYPGVWNKASPSQNQLEGCVNDAAAFRRFLVERVQVPSANIRYLTAPLGAGGPSVDPAKATAALVREAMVELQKATQPGDHVVVFYAGHGLRLERKSSPGERYYGFVPHDFGWQGDDRKNLITDREINSFLRALTDDKGASVTVIADTCHSGASTRDVGPKVRARSLDTRRLEEAEWAELVKMHSVPGGDDQVGNGERGFFDKSV